MSAMVLYNTHRVTMCCSNMDRVVAMMAQHYMDIKVICNGRTVVVHTCVLCAGCRSQDEEAEQPHSLR
jgi:hypothetical protein